MWVCVCMYTCMYMGWRCSVPGTEMESVWWLESCKVGAEVIAGELNVEEFPSWVL